MAKEVMADLGRGQRETAYKRALALCMFNNNVKSLTEVQVPIMFRGQCVSNSGADLVTDNLVVEIKAMRESPLSSGYDSQLQKYLNGMQQCGFLNGRAGVLLNFNQRTGAVEHWELGVRGVTPPPTARSPAHDGGSTRVHGTNAARLDARKTRHCARTLHAGERRRGAGKRLSFPRKPRSKAREWRASVFSVPPRAARRSGILKRTTKAPDRFKPHRQRH